MSQLVVRPGRNAARQAKKLKEIRKVKNAIQWHERERKKRQQLKQEQWESKQAVIQRIMWENENIHQVKKKALANIKEDWRLGPLRPNRAIGADAETYGALKSSQVQKPEIPVQAQRNRNEVRKRKGLELEYPLVVDDKKYFPIVKGDRVVVLRGTDAGKVGVVSDVVERTHEIIVKDINKQYYDSDVFNTRTEDMGTKHESEVPMPFDHVRLVVPSEIKQGNSKTYKDVIVEKIYMERHTTGIDPYTGTDYGDAEIPSENQYDPRNGLPIFHRYIAGTQHRIEWPWEHQEDVEDIGKSEESNEVEDQPTVWKRTVNTVVHPLTSLNRWRGKNTESKSRLEKPEDEDVYGKFRDIERKQADKIENEIPRAQDTKTPVAHDGVDTMRHIVLANAADPMAYTHINPTLIAPPFPDGLTEELRGHIRNLSVQTKKDASKDPEALRPMKITRHSEQGVLAREVALQKRRAAEAMKTPMQLRWELEHKKKVEAGKREPLVSQEELLAALGSHMAQKAGKPYLGKKTIASQSQDLD